MKDLSIIIAGCLRIPARLECLKRTVNGLKAHLPEAEFLLGLDNSTPQLAFEAIQFFPGLVLSHDMGLGYSWNWGIQSSKREFILQMEDDWECLCHWGNINDPGSWRDDKGRTPDLVKKIQAGMEECAKDPCAFMRFDNAILPKEILDYAPGWKTLRTDSHTGYTLYELNKCEPARWMRGFNPYFYSNRPHLKRRSFHEHVGWYMDRTNAVIHMSSGMKDLRRELVPNTEFDMAKKVIWHPRTRCLVYDYGTFAHIGGEAQAR